LIKDYPRLVRILQTKFGDHQSISGDDVQSFFFIFSFSGPFKGANQINMSEFDKRLPQNARDKV
jgi:hypothetical protein